MEPRTSGWQGLLLLGSILSTFGPHIVKAEPLNYFIT